MKPGKTGKWRYQVNGFADTSVPISVRSWKVYAEKTNPDIVIGKVC